MYLHCKYIVYFGVLKGPCYTCNKKCLLQYLVKVASLFGEGVHLQEKWVKPQPMLPGQTFPSIFLLLLESWNMYAVTQLSTCNSCVNTPLLLLDTVE